MTRAEWTKRATAGVVLGALVGGFISYLLGASIDHVIGYVVGCCTTAVVLGVIPALLFRPQRRRE